MAARLGRRAWMLVWGAVAVVAAAVLTIPTSGTPCVVASDDCVAEAVSLVGMPTNWSVFGIVVVLALGGIYLTLHRKTKTTRAKAAD
ncbi:hypothetical protein L1785_07430 [Antribacter sp. KLBMP9083]|uniref:Uncharacterized protein n=1 Tax=Antribacter soli TaxID=2910976 RepID=A0AA41QET4_9MICO|nr:hypothetical protein [Antribacter soli]MCF4120807.1 hypothetical protein [Antribacter soli]